jgi:hypothetical protein
VVHKQHVLFAIELAKDAPAATAADLLARHRAWVRAFTLEARADHVLIESAGEWRVAKLCAAGGLVRVDGLCAGTCYRLYVSTLDGRGCAGAAGSVAFTTLAESVRVQEWLDLPPGWHEALKVRAQPSAALGRLTNSARIVASLSRRLSSVAPARPAEARELSRSPPRSPPRPADGSADDLAVLEATAEPAPWFATDALSPVHASHAHAKREAEAKREAHADTIAIATRHRQCLLAAFRYACVLNREREAEVSSNRALLEVEQLRTRLAKTHHLVFRALVLVVAPGGPTVEAAKAILLAARLHIEGACALVAVVCSGGGSREAATERAALARAILNSQRLYEIPVGVGAPAVGVARRPRRRPPTARTKARRSRSPALRISTARASAPPPTCSPRSCATRGRAALRLWSRRRSPT